MDWLKIIETRCLEIESGSVLGVEGETGERQRHKSCTTLEIPVRHIDTVRLAS